jgi:hypothetical protein
LFCDRAVGYEQSGAAFEIRVDLSKVLRFRGADYLAERCATMAVMFFLSLEG